MIGVLAVERSYPALGSHLCGIASVLSRGGGTGQSIKDT